MASSDVQRKLTAIFCTDVVGYSRLMGDDPEGTLKTLTEYRQVFADKIQEYKGRVVNAPGDSILAEFTSVLDAVSCAVDIQRDLAERNQELPDDRRMDFRIGVTLGDVLVKEGAIYGDGVNVAARLESLAEPGGICISGSVHEQVKTRLPLHYEFIGEQRVKNIAEPVKTYRVLSQPGAAAHRVVGARRRVTGVWRKSALAAVVVVVVAGGLAGWYWRGYLPTGTPAESEALKPIEKPSIAVLAFENMSGDPEQEYFSDGLSESIITRLVRFSKIVVTARNSSFTYKGKPVKVQQVGRELGVRYVLEGSVQKAGERIRVTAQLIDAATGNHLWAESYDRVLTDLFAVQDEITEKIVSLLKVQLTLDEVERVQFGTTKSVEAWEHYSKGMQLYRTGIRGYHLLARYEFEEALKLDRKFVAAILGTGWTYYLEADQRLPVSDSLTRSTELARRAISLNDRLAEPYALLGRISQIKGDHDQAIAHGERAVALEPNGADWHMHLAATLSLAGRPQEALFAMKKALQLNPLPPDEYLAILGRSYYFAGRYEEAILPLREMTARNPRWAPYHFLLIASYGAEGRLEEARSQIQIMRKARIRPGAAASQFELTKIFAGYMVPRMFEYKNPEDAQRILAHLRKAGIPE